MKKRSRAALAKEQAAIDAEPRFDAAVLLCVECWRDLDSCRPREIRILYQKTAALPYTVRGPIPFVAVLEWTRFRCLDAEATVMLADVIRELDFDRSAAMDKQR